MALYVSSPHGTCTFPCTSEGVDSMLAANSTTLLRYLPKSLLLGARYVPPIASRSSESMGQLAPHSAVEYDRTSPSYCLLRGALVLRHKSSMHWLPMIVKTLRDDYGLEVSVSKFSAEDGCDESCARKAQKQAALESVIPFSAELVLSGEDYEAFSQKQRRGKTLTRFESQAVHTTATFRYHWGITDGQKFDEEFYTTYVSQVSKASDVTAKKQKLRALKR